MEFKDYFKLLKSKLWLILIFIVVTMLGVYLFTISSPVTYDGSAFINIAIQRPAAENQDYYDYDNYYALQASSLFTDSVASWLKDPSSVVEIYNQAQINTPNVNIKDYSKIIKTTKLPPSSIQIIINNSDSQASEKIATESINFVKRKLDEWKKDGLVKDLYIDSTSPVVSEHKTSLALNLIIGLVAGFVIGLVVIYIQEIIKEK